jgi:hypothetical protein
MRVDVTMTSKRRRPSVAMVVPTARAEKAA